MMLFENSLFVRDDDSPNNFAVAFGSSDPTQLRQRPFDGCNVDNWTESAAFRNSVSNELRFVYET